MTAPSVKNVSFVKSALNLADLPTERLPQIAFLGRSNVGKSSLLNALFGRKIVKVSATPGKTQELNFFSVNGAFYAVDLPGVGYAKVSFAKQTLMENAIRHYIEKAEDLRGIIYLVDIRHGGTPRDIETVAHIRAAGRPVLIVASKRDKLSATACKKNLEIMAERFGLESLPLAVSSLKKQGLDELWLEILQAVGNTEI